MRNQENGDKSVMLQTSPEGMRSQEPGGLSMRKIMKMNTLFDILKCNRILLALLSNLWKNQK